MSKDNLLEGAVEFAAQKHAGKFRKGSKLPYIVHPMEAAAICASFTDDVEVLAAAVLHDVVEDAGVTVDELEGKFGSRVAAIVAGESEDKREGVPAAQTWKVRKLEGIEHVRNADDIGVKMVCLGDKLSNMRAIHRDFEELGDELWSRFNQKDPNQHAWYYRTLAEALEPVLAETAAWRELAAHIDAVFGGNR